MSLISTYQSRKSLFAEKLITKGVEASATDGLTTLINKIEDIQSFTEGLLLYADKKIAQSEDTVNLYALLLEDNVAVSGETVRFYSDIPFTTTSITSYGVSLGDDYWVSTSSTANCGIGKGGSEGFIQFNSTTIQIYTSSWSPEYHYIGKFHIKDKVLTYTDTNRETQTIDLTGVATSQSYGTATGPFTVEYFWKDAVTNSDGVATIDYDCTGSGLREFYATYGSFVSEIYSVLDCYVKDMGTLDDHNDSMWTAQNVTFTPRQAGYTDIIKGTGSSLLISSELPIGSVIEFEMRQIGGTKVNYIFGLRQANSYLGDGTSLNNLGANVDEWVRVKVELKDDGYAIATNLDDTSRTDRVNSTAYTSNPKFAFWLSDTAITDLYFRNFKVYPI